MKPKYQCDKYIVRSDGPPMVYFERVYFEAWYVDASGNRFSSAEQPTVEEAMLTLYKTLGEQGIRPNDLPPRSPGQIFDNRG